MPGTPWPNPGSNGVFQLQLPTDFGTGTLLTVADALGRPVLHQPLTATAAGASTGAVDLHRKPAGAYTLRLTTAAATATQRLVRG